MIPDFTPIDFEQRRARVAQSVRQAGFDAYVGTRQAGLHYLTGAFMPWRGAVIVTADGDTRFIYWAWDASRIGIEARGTDLITFTFADFARTIARELGQLGVAGGRIGIDLAHPGAAQVAPGMMCASEYLELRDLLPQATLDNGVDLLDDVMLCKGPEEIERLRFAAHVADIGFHAGRQAVRPGVTENSVAGVIEKAIRDNGSTWSWAITGGTEVGSGDRTGYLHGVTQQATDKLIGTQEFVILDLHPMIDLYLADSSIPVFVGKPSERQRALIDCWEEVVATMIDGMRPGRSIPDVVREGLAVFERHRLSDYCLPTFGHGLGTCARTRPFVNLRSTDVVKPGMVMALGTHLYVPDAGGMRLEFPLLATEGAAEPLMKTPPKVHFV
jgi:Xaa-Pro aminopeptidase